MADPVNITCSVSPCTVQLAFNDPIFAMDTEDAGLVAVSIITVWAVAYAFRVLIRTLNVDKEDSSNSD